MSVHQTRGGSYSQATISKVLRQAGLSRQRGNPKIVDNSAEGTAKAQLDPIISGESFVLGQYSGGSPAGVDTRGTPTGYHNQQQQNEWMDSLRRVEPVDAVGRIAEGGRPSPVRQCRALSRGWQHPQAEVEAVFGDGMVIDRVQRTEPTDEEAFIDVFAEVAVARDEAGAD